MAAYSVTSGGSGELPNREAMSHMRAMFGPTAVDDAIRQAIHMCWMFLPEEKRNMQEVEQQIRRLLDRAIENAKEDVAAFGMPDAKPADQ